MEVVDGPWFDELSVGDVFEGAPSVTLTSGHADDLSTVGAAVAPAVPDWDLAAFRARVPGNTPTR